MSDTEINIIIRTLKEGFGDKDTKSALKELSSGFQQATGLSLGYAGALTATIAVTKKLVDVTKESIQVEVDQANQISKIMSMTGDSADVTSRFIKVSEDQRLTYESLNAAMQAMVKKGLDPSAEAMGRLSDEYLAYAPGVERANFLTDNFGKAGTEMYKVMQLGSTAIKEKMAAVSASNVLDDAAVTQTLKYQSSVNELNDALDGMKLTLAKGVTPSLTDFNIVLADAIENADEMFSSYNKNKSAANAWISLLSPVIGLVALEVEWGNKLIHARADQITQDKEATKTINDYDDRLDENYQMTVLSTGEYISNTMAVLDNADALKAGLSGAIQKATEAEDASYASILKATQELLYQKVVAGLTGDAAVEMAHKLGIMSDADYEAVLAAKAISQEVADGTISMNDGATAAQNLANMIAGLQDKHIVITAEMVTNFLTGGSVYSASSGGNRDVTSLLATTTTSDATKKVTYTTAAGVTYTADVNADGTYSNRTVVNKALGGSFDAGQVMMVGEKGPEPVVFNQPGTVIPNGARMGGDVTININGAGDPKAVAKEVMKELNLQGVGK